MKRIVSMITGCVVSLYVSGCASTTANYPLKPSINPKDFSTKAGSDSGIYFRTAGSYPNTSPYWNAVAAQNQTTTDRAISPDVIAAAISALVSSGVDLAKLQADIRNGNVAAIQEVFAWGYTSPEQLNAIKAIIEAWGKASNSPMP